MSVSYCIKAILRDSTFGQTVYHVSGRRLFKPEFEQDSYTIPKKYLIAPSDSQRDLSDETRGSSVTSEDKEPHVVSETQDAPIIVDWDGPDDPACPYNWPFLMKFITGLVMAVATASLYMGSAIFTPAEPKIQDDFEAPRVRIMLGLSLFVWGYGIASLWFSPMSENPLFGGRLYIFMINQVLFAVLQIPTALAKHVAPFVVLRLLAGCTASPPLSTGAAVYGDIFRFPQVSYALVTWSLGCIMGPYVGPLIGAALSQHNSWRWVFWYLLIQAGGVLVLMVFFFPETSSQAILMRKARSLRRRTGNKRILAPGDIEKLTQKPKELLKYIFWNPVKLIMREPALLLMNLHLGLMYGVMYLYFEAVPITYGEVYGFNSVQQGLAYLAVLAGCCIIFCLYIAYLRHTLLLPTVRQENPNPFKVFGNVAIVAAFMAPTAMFIFGWCSHRRIHWIVSMVGNGLFGGALSLMFQSYLSLIANLNPSTQVASAFASNNLSRSLLAGAFPLFGRTMYDNLAIDGYPVAWGCSLLAFIGMILIPLPIYLRLRGEQLHNKAVARYATK